VPAPYERLSCKSHERAAHVHSVDAESPLPILLQFCLANKVALVTAIKINNVQPGPIDTDLNPAAAWAVSQKAATALDRYRTVGSFNRICAFC
jgi:hypothetical protein